MISSIPQWTLNEWKAWYELHNLVGSSLDPSYRGDIRVAKGFAILANHWRKDKPLQPEDLMPYKPKKPAQTPEQLQAALSSRADARRRKLDRTVARESLSDGNTLPQADNQTRTRQRRTHQRVKVRKVQSDGDGEGGGNS